MIEVAIEIALIVLAGCAIAIAAVIPMIALVGLWPPPTDRFDTMVDHDPTEQRPGSVP